LEITKSGGGTFNFHGFKIANYTASTSINIIGYRGGPAQTVDPSIAINIWTGLDSDWKIYTPSAVIYGIDKLRIESANNSQFDPYFDDFIYSFDTPISSLVRLSPATSVTNATSVIFRATFAAAVTGVTASNFDLSPTLTGASIGSVTAVGGSGNTQWDIAVDTGTGDGTLTLRLANDTGLSSTISTAKPYSDQSYTVDKTPVQVAINQAAGQADPTGGSPIHFTVNFSKPVAGFVTGKVAITGTAAGSLVATVSGGPATFDVSVAGMSGSGSVIASINANAAIDAAGNSSLASTSTDNVVTYDGAAPSVTTFTADPISTSLDIPITAFTAADDLGVAGYLVTASNVAPAAGDGGWTGSRPATFHVAAVGNYTLYPWAKDAAGQVSAVFASPVSVNVCLAAVLVVTSNDSGGGSLRQAIADACPGATITFAPELAGQTIILASELTLTKDLTITGLSGSGVRLSGNHSCRAFYISGAVVTLENLTLMDCWSLDGGAIFHGNGPLTLNNCTLSNNTSASQGGGIYNEGLLILNNCTLRANAANGFGGAICNTGSGWVRLNYCTLYHNAALASDGIRNGGQVTMANTLLAQGGGINWSSTIGTPTGSCHNNLSDDTTLVGVPGFTQVTTGALLLGTFGNYGGPTQTVPLLPGSVAIGAAAPIGLPFDQRGVVRPGGSCDVGAFQSQDFTLTKTAGDIQTAVVNTAFSSPLTVGVTSTAGDPVNGGSVTFTAPGSGASTSNTSQVATIAGGSAQVGETANGTAGTYSVAAATTNAATVNFSLTNGILAPTVTTQAVSAVAATAATGNGTITASNGADATTVGVIFWPYDNVAKLTSDGVVTNVSSAGSFGPGTFTQPLASLQCNSRYNASAYAINGGGTGYGGLVAFWTLANVPGAPMVNGVTATTLNVTINLNGNPASTEFLIQETGGNYVQAGGTLGAGQVWQTSTVWGTKTVTGLATGSTYTFRVMARNGANTMTAFGATTSVLAVAAPTVTTQAVSALAATSATGNANITATNGANADARGVILWISTGSDKNLGDPGVIALGETGNFGTGAFTESLSSLAVNTHYDYRAYAFNPYGSNYGARVSFWTLANVPAAPTVNGATATTLNVTVNGNNNPASTEFAIQETGGNYVQAGGTLGAGQVWQTSGVWGTRTVTGLSAGTTYTFQVKARNGALAETTFGATAAGMAMAAPTVTTQAASAISATAATGNGNLTASNGANASARGLILYAYSNTDKLIGEAGVTTLSTGGSFGPGAFSAGLVSLAVNTPFNARAFATNPAGTGYGARVAFWTLANVPAAPTVTNPTSNSLDLLLNGAGNPAGTLFCIQETGSARFVQADGNLGLGPVWQSAAAWGSRTVQGLTSGTSYSFRVKARNGEGTETGYGASTAGMPHSPLAITGQPGNTTVLEGAAASFAVTTTGSVMGYHWMVNSGSGFTPVSDGAVYSGSSSATLRILRASAAMNGYTYKVFIVPPTTQAVTSNAATLTVNAPPTLITHPQDLRAALGSTAQFTVVATGTPAPSYRWQRSRDGGATWNDLSWGILATCSLCPVASADNGARFRVVVDNGIGSPVTSAAAKLTVGMAANDFNGDGTSDLLWRNSANGWVFVMPMGNGAPLAGAVAWIEPSSAWQIVATGDLDGDGKADQVWWNSTTGQVYVMLMDGTGVRSSALVYTEPDTAWRIAAVADFTGSGKAALLWRHSASGLVYLMPMDGLSWQAGGSIWCEPDPAWQIVAAADFTGDGKAGILWQNRVDGTVFLMQPNGIGPAAGSTIYTEPNLDWRIIGAGDFAGTGTSGILWRNSGNGQVFVMPLANGIPQPGAIVWTEASKLWQIAAIGDFDGDGKSDILWWNRATGQVYQLLMNGLVVKSAGSIYLEPNTAWSLQAGGCAKNH
jgi:hypothetical protein